MVTFDQAREIAGAEIGEGTPGSHGLTPVIIDDYTRRICQGWVFFWDSREYLESGTFSKRLTGNAPLIVSECDGSVSITGTAHPIEHYIKAFESDRDGQ